MALTCSNLAQVPAGAGAASPNTTSSGTISVTAGDLLVVTAHGWEGSDTATPSFSVSATGSGWAAWAAVAPVRFNGAYSGSSQAFIAVVPGGVSSTVISVTITDATATQVTVGFNVDQISGQGTIGTPNGVSGTSNYTGTPGSALNLTAAATTSLVYAWLAADSAYTADVTAQPTGFTETALFAASAGPANETLGCAYKIGSSTSPTAYPWTVDTNAFNIVGLLEVPVGALAPLGAFLFFDSIDQADLAAWASSGRFKMALLNTQPSLSTALYSSLTGEVANGHGYLTGGAALSSPTHVVTAAASWPNAWTSGHVYAVNDIVTSSGAAGYLFRCVSAGTAGGAAPTQTTEGALDTSSTGAVFVNVGQSVEVWSSAPQVWTASGGSIGPATCGVIYDSVTGANLLLINFGATKTATSGQTITVDPDSTRGWFATLPQ